MGIRVIGKREFFQAGGRFLTVRLLMVLLVFQFSALNSAWANTKSVEEGNSLQIWSFDTETAGKFPKNFVVGKTPDGRHAGDWQVIDMKQALSFLHDLNRPEHMRIKKVLQTLDAPSPPQVMAQLKNRGFEQDYNVVLVQGPTITDCDLMVSMLPVAGKADMGGGLIWRAQDAQNYYLTRANPLEQNIRLYRVVKGVRYKLANYDHIISVDRWHTFHVVARGSHFRIIFDGQTVLDDLTYCANFYALNFGGAREDGSTVTYDHQGAVHDHFFGQSSFGTFTLAHERNVIKVPHDAPLELLGPLGCGIQTGAGAVMNALQVKPGSSFAAFGGGAVGLSAVMAARVCGATTIIAADVVPSRLDLAKELGATHIVNSRETDPVEAVRTITKGGCRLHARIEWTA